MGLARCFPRNPRIPADAPTAAEQTRAEADREFQSNRRFVQREDLFIGDKGQFARDHPINE